ncbi:hypothetical protein AHF37_08802 [Paragonimus kellicotti]|nr:hypothetical protein AHF37_08802 [Paragonimus kellicotti]
MKAPYAPYNAQLFNVPASGAYFLSYEWIKELLRKSTDSGDHLSVGKTLCSPASRYQSAPEGRYPKGIRSVFTEMIAKEGFLALYKGVTPVLLRAFPANAVSVKRRCDLCPYFTLTRLDFRL